MIARCSGVGAGNFDSPTRVTPPETIVNRPSRTWAKSHNNMVVIRVGDRGSATCAG